MCNLNWILKNQFEIFFSKNHAVSTNKLSSKLAFPINARCSLNVHHHIYEIRFQIIIILSSRIANHVNERNLLHVNERIYVCCQLHPSLNHYNKREKISLTLTQ